MGWDGFATLLLCMAVVTASGGLTFLACWTVVIKFARLPATKTSAADVILVMGGRLNSGEVTPEFQARLDEAVRLAVVCPIIVLGGVASNGGPTEAGAGRSWLIARGFDETRIILEETSRNTLENLAHARGLMRRLDFRHPLLVSSRYHLARTSILAKGLGVTHDLAPADYPTMWYPSSLGSSLFEALMINWYYVSRAFAKVTGHETLLARMS